MQSEQPRRVLPPGIEDDVVFGVLWIRVGLLKTIKPTTAAHKVNIQFWGEASPAILYTSQTNQLPLTYQVKCPITFFQKYLHDMKKNLKIEVENLGNVNLDLSSYLKKNITLTTKNPFDHFKGFFEVQGKQNKKVGSLQLQLSSTFNPQIALLELQDEEKQQICPADNIKNCECKGLCKCIVSKINAIDVLAVEKPQLFRQFYEQSKGKSSPVKKISYQPINDNRIPNSLNNVPNKGLFDPKRYTQPENNTPKNLHIFPTVEKILTYSNLKLKKDEQIYRQPSMPISIKQNLPQISQTVSQNIIKPQLASREELLRQQRQKPTAMFLGDKKVSQRQMKKKLQQKDIPIFPAVQIVRDPHLSDVSEVQKMDESVSVQAQKQILSRVVNLNAQLERQRRSSPIKTPVKTQKPKLMEQPYQNIPSILQSPPNLLANQHRLQKRKPSSLLLNMLIQLQTNTVTFGKVSKFILSYRPYGQKDNIRNGPQLPLNFIMMFPVGEPQIAKMNKIPFILQFWGANEGELLGVIKLSLAKIQKGFILDGRLNELAIKTSLLPTVIYNGVHSIMSLTDKPVGECYLSARIGTPAQIQSYLNSPKSQNNTIDAIPSRQVEIIENKQKFKKIEQQKMIRNEGTFEDFTNLLQLIDSNNKISFVQHLLNFTNEKEANHEQFQSFLKKIQFTGGDIFHLISTKNVMKCKQLSNSFQDYKRIKDKYIKNAQKMLMKLTTLQLNEIQQKIKQKSNFGIISKQNLSQCMPKFDDIKDYFGQIVQISSFIQWIKALGKYEYKQIVIKEANSRQFIEQLLLLQCPTFMQSIENLLKVQKNSEIQLQSIKQHFSNVNRQPFSLWFWIQLSKIVYDSFGEEQKNIMVINTSLLYNWLVLKSKQKQVVRESEQDIHFKKTVRQQREHRELQRQQSVQQKPKQNQSKQIEKQRKPQQFIIKPINNQINKQNKSLNVSNQLQKPVQVSQQKVIQHQFVISLQQLQLEQDLSGQCTVLYRFPFEEQQVSSRKIQLLRDKHRYKLTCTGTHKFTINQPIDKYLGESTLSVRVVMGKEGQLYGDLHSQELITRGSQLRVIPLFTSNRQGMVGKIKLRIQYLHHITEQMGLGRETIKDVFLPKNGYLNFETTSSVDQSRLRNQFNIKEQFYIQISIDIFGQNSSLSPHFPPFHSKLYSDLSSQLSILGSIKVTLNPQILQHLRGGSCQAKMMIVYYAKEKGNYQRKQLLVASFKAPLFAVIREQGLRGDYAFKNKLGMFVALAHTSIKYQKTPKIQAEGGKAQQNSRENFWLVMDFCEIINFEGDLGNVKFEVVSKGKRFTTEKTLIREQGSFQLDSKCLSLQMGQQQFSITKILPISVIAGSNKYCMDINLRPVAKLLGRQKYSINSQYFIVVDDQSRSKKIRVGVKIYAFRAQPNFTHFIQALSKNCIRNDSIGQQKVDNYQQEIQNLRKHLKMSGKAFDEAISQIQDKRKKQKLPQIFFTSKIQSSLDLSPILAYNQSDVYLLAEQLTSQIDQRQLLQYIQQSGFKLVNLRPQFIQRYSFNKLNQLRLDQNVEYLGLSKQIDLLVFAHKIKIEQVSEEQIKDKTLIGHRMMRISIIRGYNFHLLYNGITPNARICLPGIGLETDIIERSSQPIFNEHINLQLVSSQMKKLKIEVYHQASQQTQAIMIGEGTLSLLQAVNSHQIPYSKVHRAVLSSLMSNRMQAALDIKIQINSRNQLPERSYSEIDESIGDSRVEEAMDRIHKLQDYKKRVALFQSSDQD